MFVGKDITYLGGTFPMWYEVIYVSGPQSIACSNTENIMGPA